jgi:uncharacterized membrane protein (UPF0127 family)
VLHSALTAPPAASEGFPVRTLSSVLAAALGLLALLPASPSAVADPLLTYPLKIKGHTLRAELARTEEEMRTGLMFRRELGENNGMIFVYAREERWAMWMKNTYVPLSVAFIDRDGKILNIEDMEPLTLDSHQASAPARYALEMNRGWFEKRGIRPGDRVLGLEKLPRE